MYLRAQKNQAPCERQSKFILERILSVEKHFSEICSSLSAYTRKAARVRDKGDELAKVVQTYAMSEKINKSLSQGLLNFSRALFLLSDHRDAEVIRLEKKVIQEFSNYGSICKNAKEELKQSINVRDKEIAKKRHLDKIREKSPAKQQQITLAENELTKSSAEVIRSVRNLEKQTETFEKQKLRDLKSFMLDFIQIEMALHAKAIEILTTSYQDISNIDEQADFQDFYRSMKIQKNKFPNDYKEFSVQERAKSQSMGDLFLAQPLRDQKDQNVLQSGLAHSMDSINSERYVKPVTEGISNVDYNYELETDEESSIQIRPFFKSN